MATEYREESPRAPIVPTEERVRQVAAQLQRWKPPQKRHMGARPDWRYGSAVEVVRAVIAGLNGWKMGDGVQEVKPEYQCSICGACFLDRNEGINHESDHDR
jgi:hypothetical protein